MTSPLIPNTTEKNENADKSEVIILQGNCLQVLDSLPDESVQCCITSPPYYKLRDYGTADQIGLEKTPEQFIEKLVIVFREVRRVLHRTGILWLNLNDTMQNKQMLGIPWRVALALQADGLFLRQDIIWAKPSPVPEPARDRCVRSHEFLFMLTKQPKYYFNSDALREKAKKPKGGSARKFGATKQAGTFRNDVGRVFVDNGFRNKRDVWTVANPGYVSASGKHFASFPEALVLPCVLASTKPGDKTLDPFSGTGTVSAVSLKNGRNSIAIELSPDYCEIIQERLDKVREELSNPPKIKPKVQKYSQEWYAAHGASGGKTAAKNMSPEARRQRALRAVQARKAKRAAAYPPPAITHSNLGHLILFVPCPSI